MLASAPDSFDDCVGIGYLSVGHHHELRNSFTTRGLLEHELDGRKQFRAAERGAEFRNVGGRFRQRALVVWPASLNIDSNVDPNPTMLKVQPASSDRRQI